jgi:hypothetical protein
MNSISIPFEDSINAQALEHKSVMVDAYTKMKPDSFKSQLQAVLTTYYEDIKGVQGGSGCHKTRIVKHRFEDQGDDASNEGVDASAGAAGATSSWKVPAAPAQAPSPVRKAGALVAKKETT